MKKSLKSLKSELYTKDELSKIKGGLASSDGSGDDTCTSIPVGNSDVYDCMDPYSGYDDSDIVKTSQECDDCITARTAISISSQSAISLRPAIPLQPTISLQSTSLQSSLSLQPTAIAFSGTFR